MSTITASLLALIMSVPVAPVLPAETVQATAVPTEVSASAWNPEIGDKIVVDTLNNAGYIIHDDGRYIRFPVVTGQRRFVSYIGRYYNASTPNWNWVAKSMHIKGDRVTFGPTGRFLRLYKDGEMHTAYGFHEYRTDEEMFGENGEANPPERFRSMGCIIVRRAMMDVIVSTWELNNEHLNVVTQHGVSDLRDVIAQLDSTENL